MTKSLTREALVAAAKPKMEKVSLPQGVVYVKQWRLREADEIHSFAQQMAEAVDQDARDKFDGQWRTKVVQHSVCDSDGVPLFDDDTIDQHKELPAEIVGQLVKAALLANGITQEQIEAVAKADESPN